MLAFNIMQFTPYCGVHVCVPCTVGYTYTTLWHTCTNDIYPILWNTHTKYCGTHVPSTVTYNVPILFGTHTLYCGVCVPHSTRYLYPSVHITCTSQVFARVYHSAGYVCPTAQGTCIPQYKLCLLHSTWYMYIYTCMCIQQYGVRVS